MLRQALRVASREAVLVRGSPVLQQQQQQQQFVRNFAGPVVKKEFKPASRSHPEHEYVETPSMLYVTAIVTVPVVISFWGLTRLV
mmetsp:Transcript_37978/g.90833  ORF Transcript_37978/g.90833 Transcript_37978/m.90833 type:complete len:85 (-) Transcript_37978:87-341(-)|eukprot:CAMPEP_0181429508 /NCGR_PEP_ID=MMETSP1110-20121109/17236_1 /TAXON_ID=174948 /ORGANISM="Symbiodinium sp., Strain CCMP421" /LENGTH=84 /DNA_ID=CAMNT_0023552779 /DNA_START=75 /DNA_END=329 /DNA_ORIENTATION=+